MDNWGFVHICRFGYGSSFQFPPLCADNKGMNQIGGYLLPARAGSFNNLGGSHGGVGWHDVRMDEISWG